MRYHFITIYENLMIGGLLAYRRVAFCVICFSMLQFSYIDTFFGPESVCILISFFLLPFFLSLV